MGCVPFPGVHIDKRIMGAICHPMAMTKRRSIALNEKQQAFLEKEAERLGITVADVIRRIIDHYRSFTMGGQCVNLGKKMVD